MRALARATPFLAISRNLERDSSELLIEGKCSRREAEKGRGRGGGSCMHACATYTHTNAHFLYLQPTCDASTTAYSYFSPSLRE